MRILLVISVFIVSLFVLSLDSRAQRIIGGDPCSDSIYLVYPEDDRATHNYYLRTPYHQAVSDYFNENSRFGFEPFNWRESEEIPVYIKSNPDSKIEIIAKSEKLKAEIHVEYKRVTFAIVNYDPQDLYNLYENVIADSFGLDDSYLMGYPAMPWGAPNLALDSITFFGVNLEYLGHVDASDLQREYFLINPDFSFAGWTYPRAFVFGEKVMVLYIFGSPDTRRYLTLGDSQGFAPYLLRVMFDISKPEKMTAHALPGRMIRRYGFAFKKCFENAFF